MKKAVSLLLALCLCLGLAVPALAADDVTSGSCGQYTIWTFDKATGTLTISGKGEMDGWSGDSRRDPLPWQSFLQEIRAVVVEEGVTYIGTLAFNGCSALTRVTIPRSVTAIGSAAFEGTLWLQSLGEFAIVNGILIKYQGDAEHVAIPEGVTYVSTLAFASKPVVSVDIPEGVVCLANDAFAYCEKLEKISFPDTLREVGPNCFSGTKWLSGQKGDFILAGNVLLKYRGAGGDVVIPDGVTDVEDAAFTWSSWFPFAEDLELDTLTVPASMLDLNADLAFFTSIPKSVTYQGGRDQWNRVEHTEWHDGQEVPVRCTGETDPAGVFADMEPNAFYLDAVAWAVKNEITMGTTATTFSPKQDCTHGHILTFLWRAAGEPESSVVTPFAMEGDEYYYGAAKWAYERNMINAGFDPKARCSRVDAVNYIWQAMGKPYAVYDGRFTDLPANSPYAQAVAWAADKGVTTGATDTTFDPSGICNRGQIVTFLHRAYK